MDPLADKVSVLITGEQSLLNPGAFVSYGSPPASAAIAINAPDYVLGDSANPARAGSLRFNNAVDNSVRGLQIPYMLSPSGRGAFCVEFYAKLTGAPTYQNAFNTCGSNAGGNFSVSYEYTLGKWQIALYDGARPSAVSSVQTAIGDYVHIAAVRNDSDVFRLFIEGTRVAELAYVISVSSAAPIIGYNSSYSPQNFYGHIHDFRITLGDSRYWDDFTPPAPFEVADAPLGSLMPLHFQGKGHFTGGHRLPVFPGVTVNPRIASCSPNNAAGAGRIIGTVKEKASPINLPLARRVVLIRHYDDRRVREGWSNDAGQYVFENVDARAEYYVVAFDHTGTYRAVIADRLKPTV